MNTLAVLSSLVIAMPAQPQASHTRLSQEEYQSESRGLSNDSPKAVAEASEWGDLSLEQLMNIQFSQREPMSIHHTHSNGEWMIHASAMFMRMDDNRNGTDSMSDAEVLESYPVAPTRMESEMYMFGMMYAPTERLTLMVMAPYNSKSMDHLMRTGMSFVTQSEGPGDTKVTALYTAWRTPHQKVHLDLGISIPTGSVDKKDTTPGGRIRLPYPMQLGSGTWDIHPGVTYQGFTDEWSWGANLNSTVRPGLNDNEYRLGHRLQASMWGSYKLTHWLSTHLRFDGSLWGNIHGADPQLNSAMVPTADPDLRGGERVDFGVGINLFGVENGLHKGHRLSCEVAIPIYQSLHGPQLETDWTFKAGWNWKF